ncbi:DUF3313 family protein [Luteolibacter luteus]|uniref:DUF3313 domain-containing protein n=1 Tax=Luteolibacter luteus TaxID=2728835 RepID=A0A858RGJ9_9BACT|nr:DUF3313 family protein [Luteolibacter luteus]QJE95684.1 DUF3313 domain-containing protein [Luteolibacter luteus]
MNPILLRRVAAISLSATALFVTSCASSSQNGRGAFLEKSWASTEFKQTDVQKKYSSVHIAPVDTSNLAKQDWWQSQNARVQSGVLKRDARKLAQQLETSLAREIRAYPGNRLSVVSRPGPNTLTIRMAITELTPSKAYWNMGATAAGFVVPGAGLLSMAGSGSIAVSGTLQDSKGKVASFSDRRSDPVSPVNLRSYEWYGGAEANIEIWAKQGAQFLNTPPGSTVKRTSGVTLNPF